MRRKVLIAGGLLIFAGSLWGLAFFLRGQGLERADQWSGVFGLFLNIMGVALGTAGVVVAILAWRDARRAPETSTAATPFTVGSVSAGRDAYVAETQYFGPRSDRQGDSGPSEHTR
ncbi:hypothetical protein [Sphaerisporangium rubeum]|uniref:Uncharacterized protein n=1 Tax=Sphaerisporangium rubeum TaxID=321317 RepID=A0A7X0IJ14_9ACTN|nr:hypothetical protein [Sphaerisporangium rubeum]MBB6476115.1 hypothetical protein [Sphaerisporangium rubeum]